MNKYVATTKVFGLDIDTGYEHYLPLGTEINILDVEGERVIFTSPMLENNIKLETLIKYFEESVIKIKEN